MDPTHLHQLAKKIARETGFTLGREIYRGSYYAPEKIRNVIFEGSYRNKPAVLKLYDDPRLTDEPVSQIAFNKVNTSALLVAPEVYEYKLLSPRQGWFIMEKLPEGGSFFAQPVENKHEFARLFLEYRLHFPMEPTRPLTLAEHLPADEYHIYRISRWLEQATGKEAEMALTGSQSVLRADQFMPRFKKALSLIRREFSRRKMIWCHGHFKPHELYKLRNKEQYYVIDFAHTKLYPEGYELAFIIWADWLMSADWRVPYQEWKKGVDGWLEVLRPIAEKLNTSEYNRLMAASLAERIMGTLLADVCASARPRAEKEARIALLYQLFDERVHSLLRN